jgi:hypothetical protein
LDQALAVSQAFSLAKLRILRLLFQKLKFWNSLDYINIVKNSKFHFTWEENGRYKYEAENIEPENKNQMIMVFVDPFDIYGEYHVELG